MNKIQKEEIELWQQQQHQFIVKRMYKMKKIYYDSRKKAYEDYKHHRSTQYWYRHKNKYVKIHINGAFRRK